MIFMVVLFYLGDETTLGQICTNTEVILVGQSTIETGKGKSEDKL